MPDNFLQRLKPWRIALAFFCACGTQACAQVGTVSVSGGGYTGGAYGTATASWTGECSGTLDNEPYFGGVSVQVAGYGNEVLISPESNYADSVTVNAPASPGSYTVVGSYSGFSGVDSSGNPCTISGDTEYADVEVPFYPTETTVSLTTSSFQEGLPVTIPVTIANEDFSPTLTGDVTLNYGSGTSSVKLASAAVTQGASGNGDATITASSSGIAPGNYSVYVAYSGDDNCAPSSTSPFTITILHSQLATSTTLAVTANPVVVNEKAGISVTVKPTGSVTPTGTISLLASGKTVATISLTSAENGTASISLPTEVAAGTYTLQALYSGDKFNLPSTSNQVSLTVDSTTATTTTLSVSPASAGEGGTVEIGVEVIPAIGDGTPTGTVTISANGTALSTLRLAGGSASLDASTSGYAPGNYTVTAAYSGDATDTASHSSAQKVTILQVTTVTVTASPNPVTQGTITTLTATVKNGSNAVTSGTITFSDGVNILGTASLNSSGMAQLPISTSALAPGTYSVEASFAGNSSDPAGSGTVSLVVK